ncbi:MAG: endonuclease V [Pseudomonadota bacterium]
MKDSLATRIAIDVHYQDDSAYAAGVLFERWPAEEALDTIRCERHGLAPYEPGQFYKRELPVIIDLLALLEKPAQTIVIDGYVNLGRDQHAGLGEHLWNALRQSTAIIGVAKNRFRDTPSNAALLRGTSTKPLYVSAIGISLVEAKQAIAAMHGEHRLPTLLKLADRLCRQC